MGEGKREKVSDHLMILRCGVKVWNRWRKASPGSLPILEDANLKDAKLVGADLRGASLVGADLSGANLESADLKGANLESTDLKDANLESADLEDASLWDADLRGAVLVGANLEGVFLEDSDLSGANLRSADLFSTLFHNLDLRVVKGLDKAHHSGPSPVSSQTLKKSQGQIPEAFLKGCGLEDWEILSAKLHDPNLRPDQVADITYEIHHVRAESPIVPLSVFISYCHEDQRFVDKLEARFDKARIRYWRDVHDLHAGPLEAQVDRAIGLQRATLLVLSEGSVGSDWVELEVERAREVEKARQECGEGEYVLCPIALDESWKDSRWPRRIRNQIEKYSILDFSRWGSDEEFDKQFERLKTGLRIYYANKGAGESPSPA